MTEQATQAILQEALAHAGFNDHRILTHLNHFVWLWPVFEHFATENNFTRNSPAELSTREELQQALGAGDATEAVDYFRGRYLTGNDADGRLCALAPNRKGAQRMRGPILAGLAEDAGPAQLTEALLCILFDYGTTSSMGGRKPHTGIKNKPTIFSMPMRFFELGFAA